jgi:hypothetical protein
MWILYRDSEQLHQTASVLWTRECPPALPNGSTLPVACFVLFAKVCPARTS